MSPTSHDNRFLIEKAFSENKGPETATDGTGEEVVLIHIPRLTEPFTTLGATVQAIASRPGAINSVVVTGILDIDSHNINTGDLIILTLPNVRAGVLSLSSKADVLRNEVGSDGHWLLDNPEVLDSFNSIEDAGPHLLYLNSHDHASEMIGTDTIWRRLLESFAKQGVGSGVDCVVALGGMSRNHASNRVKRYLARATSSYVMELLHGVAKTGLGRTIEEMKKTETVVPSYAIPSVPPFPTCNFPQYGHKTLLMIPTANKSKRELIQKSLVEQKPPNVTLHTVVMGFDSGVGEQPYNDAGVLGAHNRISNAIQHISSRENHELLRANNIGTVLIASIENFIQLRNVDRPTDYGVVVVHNATTGQTAVAMSSGVTVPEDYIDRARRFGFANNADHGRVTVGQILAANVPGLDKADWHSILAGRSRYELLSEAIAQLSIPW